MSFIAANPAPSYTIDHAFVARVTAWTGGTLPLSLEVHPSLSGVTPPGQIIASAHEGRAFLCTVGYPSQDEEGNETFEAGRLLMEAEVADLYRHLVTA